MLCKAFPLPHHRLGSASGTGKRQQSVLHAAEGQRQRYDRRSMKRKIIPWETVGPPFHQVRMQQ